MNSLGTAAMHPSLLPAFQNTDRVVKKSDSIRSSNRDYPFFQREKKKEICVFLSQA
jgi:hypothetical protein